MQPSNAVLGASFIVRGASGILQRIAAVVRLRKTVSVEILTVRNHIFK